MIILILNEYQNTVLWRNQNEAKVISIFIYHMRVFKLFSINELHVAVVKAAKSYFTNAKS